MIEQYDLVLADMVKMGKTCDELASKGKLVLGGGVFNDKAELDRDYGEKAWSYLTEANKPNTSARTADTIKVATKAQLLETLKKATTPQVVKPLGNKPPELTMVSSDVDNRTIISIATKLGEEIMPCIVQEKIDGVEISTEGWFNGREWIKPFNHTMEKKRFMEHNKGPNVGCMGNLVWLAKSNKLTKTVLEPLEPLLAKVGYVGPLDVNCIVTKDTAYFLELTARFGYDAIQTLFELLKRPIFDTLYGVASGSLKAFDYTDEYAMGVRLSVHPYPAEEGTERWKGVQLLNVAEEAKKHVWLADVMKSNDVDCCAGVDGVLGCVTARGDSIRECRRRVYRTVNNIVIHQDVQYRADVDDGVEESIRRLVEWGWLL
jgi:phosphoribosylamine--glycine ligase